MNCKWLNTVVIAVAIVLTAAGALSAQNLYSQNFDGTGVTVGQSIFNPDPVMWEPIFRPTGADLLIASGLHPDWSGNAIYGSSVGATEIQGRSPWLTLPTTGQYVLSFDAYAEGTNKWSTFGFNWGSGFDPIGTWMPYAAGWAFFAKGYAAASEGFDTGHDTTVNLKVYRDADTSQVWGSLTCGGTTYTTAKYAGDPRSPQNLIIDMDSRYGGIDIDNISIDMAFATLYGHVDLMDYSGIIADKALAPVKIELSQNGVVKHTKLVTLDNLGNYTMDVPAAGTYDVALTACKWLKTTVSGKVLSSGVRTQCDASLINGDLDGDDAVTTTDLSIVLMNLQ